MFFFKLFNSIQYPLHNDLSIVVQTKKVIRLICYHPITNAQHYISFHGDKVDALVDDACQSSESKNLNQDIVDIIIQAPAQAKKLNFIIYENNAGFLQEIRINGLPRSLKYEHSTQNPLYSHCSHIVAVVLQ